MSGSKVSGALIKAIMLKGKTGLFRQHLNAEEVLMLEDSQPAGLHKHYLKRRLSVINLSSENNLPTFQLQSSSR